MTDLDELPPLLPQPPLKPGTPSAPDLVPFLRAEATNFEPRPGDIDDAEARLPQAPTALAAPKPGDLPRELTPMDEELRRAAELMASEPTLFGLPSILRQPLVGLVMLALGGILGLFMFNQVA